MADINQGLFLPTTPLFDVGDLTDPTQARELIIRLTQKINDIIIALNLKDTGVYTQIQYVNGQTFFPNPALTATTQKTPTTRQAYRLLVNMGPLPNAAVLSVPHNIAPTALFTFTRIYGAASDTIDLTYIPLPFASPTLINNISVTVDAVNVNITTAIDYSAYNISYVVLEFLKS